MMVDPSILKKFYELEDIEEFEDIIDHRLKVGNKKTVEEIARQLRDTSEKECLFLNEKLEIVTIKLDSHE